MQIGVPRERKTLEQRVAITPAGALSLIKLGHSLLIEQGAGEGSSFTDNDYRKAGCKIVKTLAEVWSNVDLLVKVKEPDLSEFQFFRPELILFDFLHLASLPELAQELLNKKVTAFAYENLKTSDGRLPLLEPMSVVAGKLSILNGAHLLLSQHGGRGVLLGGAAAAPPAKVTIIGAGIAGHAACATALGMGAQVTVLDISAEKLTKLSHEFPNVQTALSTSESLAHSCAGVDLLIGAVLIPGASTPRIITAEMIRSMGPRAVFVDISIDQGGCSETSRATMLDNPTYLVDGVIHYCVCNMPAQTPRTSTLALAEATLPYITKLAEQGPAKILRSTPEMKHALTCFHGKLTNKLTAEALGMPYSK